MRRTVLSPTGGLMAGSVVGLVIIAARIFGAKPARDLQDSAGKTETTKDDHQPWECVKPLIEKIANQTAHCDGGYKGEWQLHSVCKLSGSVLHLPERWWC